MDVCDFVDMIRAVIRVDNECLDEKMQILSWQTSILINAMGRSKKRYKPRDLYVPQSEGDDDSVGDFKYIGEDEKEQLQSELMEIFKDSM